MRRDGAARTSSTSTRPSTGLRWTERNTVTGNHLRSPRGYTLIELMVVMTLIVVFAAMAMAQYRTSITRSKEAVLKEDLFQLRDAIDQYYADKNQYPSGLDSLASEGYLRKVPVDPFTNSTDSWQTIPSEPDPNNPTAAPGIYDIKSGSEA